MDAKEIAKTATYIEENLRASPSAGLQFVDARRFRSRSLSSQNHIVFGRRGAGKTSLVNSIKGADNRIEVYLNLEDYKDITFPNILIHVLVQLFTLLDEQIRSDVRWWRFRPSVYRARKRMKRVTNDLAKYLHQPDNEVQQVTTIEGSLRQLDVSANATGVAARGGASSNLSEEVMRSLPRDKTEYLRLELTRYKDLIIAISALFNNSPIFLIMDDLYFVAKDIQPDLIDYFHRLTKGTELFLKLATIKHRSKLYRRTPDQYIGVELGHDIFEVDMDYTLDNFDELQAFMRQLLKNAVERSGAQLDVDDMFAGDGFAQLCLASGGVPRDFLSLFVTLANDAAAAGQPIGKVQVNEAAIANLGSKMESMRRDSGDEDPVLEAYLKKIKRYIYDEKRTNAFLIAKDDLEADDQARQAIRELVDLRLIHLVDQNTSRAPSDGRRYEAYILDIALYDNARPRNFSQIEPGRRDEKARRDELRASPVFAIERLRQSSPDTAVQLELALSEE
jgi:hypothetical protein